MLSSTGLALDVSNIKDNLSALRAMAGMVHGSGVFEGDKGGAGNMGMLNGVVIKFNTKIKERKSDDVDIKELRACNELRKNLAMRIVNYIKSEKEGITEDAVNEILSDLGVHLKKEEKSDANNAQVGAKSGDVIEKKAQVNKENIADALSKKETMLTENDFEVNDDFMLKNAIKGDKYSQLLDVEDVSVNESTGEFNYGKVDDSKLEGLVSRKKLLERTVIAKTLKKVEKFVSDEKPNTLIITNLKNRDLGKEGLRSDITLNDLSTRGFKNASFEDAKKATQDAYIDASCNYVDELRITTSIKQIVNTKFGTLMRLLDDKDRFLKVEEQVDFFGLLKKNGLTEEENSNKLLAKYDTIVFNAVKKEMSNLFKETPEEKSDYENKLVKFRVKCDEFNMIDKILKKDYDKISDALNKTIETKKENFLKVNPEFNTNDIDKILKEDYDKIENCANEIIKEKMGKEEEVKPPKDYKLLRDLKILNECTDPSGISNIYRKLSAKKEMLAGKKRILDEALTIDEDNKMKVLEAKGVKKSTLNATLDEIIKTIKNDVAALDMSEYKTEPKAVNQ